MQNTPSGVVSDGSSGNVGALSEVGVSVADKLRTVADWLDAHPGATVSDIGCLGLGSIEVNDYGITGANDIAAVMRAVGGKWEKNTQGTVFIATQKMMPGFTYRLIAMRDAVCEKVVTGQREVEVPDPDAPKITVTEDVVEYRCGPLLAGGAA